MTLQTNSYRTSFVNVVLRLLTLGGKFVLLLFMARQLTPAELGVFGLMNVTITIALLLVGLDFFQFNTREILANDDVDLIPLVRDQLVFHGLAYVIVLPLLMVVFATGTLPWKYVYWFYALLILEHISQELARLLITLSRSTAAFVVIFLRGGAWAFVAVALTFSIRVSTTLSFLWGCWTIGVGLSIVVAIVYLRKLGWSSSKSTSIDWAWIKRGVRVSLGFLSATISFMGIQYADRYFLQHYHGEDSVGVYTLFGNLANVVHLLVFTGVTVILYPKIVASFQSGALDEYRHLMRQLRNKLLIGSAIVIAILLVGIEPVLWLIDKPAYSEQLGIFGIMLASAFLLAVSHIPHYALYVRHADRAIVVSTILALGFALAANYLLVPRYGLDGAAWSTLIAMIVLVSAKLLYCWRLKRATTPPVAPSA